MCTSFCVDSQLNSPSVCNLFVLTCVSVGQIDHDGLFSLQHHISVITTLVPIVNLPCARYVLVMVMVQLGVCTAHLVALFVRLFKGFTEADGLSVLLHLSLPVNVAQEAFYFINVGNNPPRQIRRF